MENLIQGKFFYTYVLLSEKDGKKYMGFTKDLPSRLEAHNNG
jgi:putative endonuclease